MAPPAPGLVGSSADWVEITHKIADLATSDTHVLVTGERGVGKRHVALAIAAARGLAPIIADAAAAAELGGMRWLERIDERLGLLPDDAVMVVVGVERLDTGLLSDLAKVIDGRAVPSLATAVRPDTRALTRHPLDALAVFGARIYIPALRHRPDDVDPLAHHFDVRHGAGQLVWTDETLEVMRRYLWPGNASELEHTVQRILEKSSTTTVVQPTDLPAELMHRVRRHPLTRLDEAEVDVILAALAETNGNKEMAAHLIGIHRATLYRKLQNYGLDWPPDV